MSSQYGTTSEAIERLKKALGPLTFYEVINLLRQLHALAGDANREAHEEVWDAIGNLLARLREETEGKTT